MTLPRKSPLAIALRTRGDRDAARRLGRRGGHARSPAKHASSRINGHLGGQPPRYRLTAAGGLERRVGSTWHLLMPPYDRAAREALRRLTHR